MTFDPQEPERPGARRPTRSDGLPRRWPLGLPATVALIAGAAVLMGGATMLFSAGGGLSPSRDAPGLAIAHRDPPPAPPIVPGPKLDVLSGAPNGFDGVPAGPEPVADEIPVNDYLPGATFEHDSRPAPRPVERAVVSAPEPRRYRSDGKEDCTYARSRAEAMVCRDPQLAAMHDELAGAFSRAMERTSEPRRVLRDQQRWERARDHAAIDGPEAVEDLYRRRLDELTF